VLPEKVDRCGSGGRTSEDAPGRRSTRPCAPTAARSTTASALLDPPMCTADRNACRFLARDSEKGQFFRVGEKEGKGGARAARGAAPQAPRSGAERRRRREAARSGAPTRSRVKKAIFECVILAPSSFSPHFSGLLPSQSRTQQAGPSTGRAPQARGPAPHITRHLTPETGA
jgi:hypothetical protein